MASPSLFVSYSHRDTEALEQLRRFLRPLERDQGIAWWDDSRIKEGRDWAVEIAQALDAATAAVLLISQDFIDSEFIARTELPHLLARAEAGKLTILPVFLGHSTVELTSYLYVDLRSGAECRVNLTKYQGFGSSQKPLSELRKPQREKVYAELARRLTKLAGEAKPRAAFLELSQELEDAYRQKEELVTAGRETTAIDGEILALRRRIREGGQLNAGDFLADGRFKLIEQIGHGGFATVWKAYDRKTRQPVAVKVLHGQYAEDRTRRERFFRGARKMAQLQHPGIVRVIAEEGEDGGYRFFVMEHVGGGDLREAVLAERLTLEERLRILLEVGDVLDYAHHKGVIHRDVKPANILLDSTGRPKLTDFDLVRALDTTGGTRTEGMLGTFLYAAPEAMKNPKKTEATADVYSLGMTALFTIYGEDLPIEVMKDADSIIDDLSCSPAVKKALVTAVDWNRHQRFPSAAAFCRALNEALGPGPAADEVAGGEEPLIVPDDVRLVIVDPALPDSTGPHALPVEKIAELSNLIEKYPDARPQTAKELPFRLKQRTRLLPAIVDIDGRWLKPMLKPILVFLVLMGLVGSLVAGWYILHPKPTVAILGFEDLSEGVGTDWHASALSEILTVELTMDQKVRMVSEEWIAEVKSDFERESLTLGEPQGLTPETLEKLRSHLRADYLLLGTYRANSQAGEPRLRVDLRLQDTGDSDVPWQETFDSPDGDLFALATAAGNALRIWLDADALSPEERSQVRALFPAGTEALELYFQGRHR
ncbi:MAG: protein kinase, partial [bacterium]|nr:protein kinase [bacterium]